MPALIIFSNLDPFLFLSSAFENFYSGRASRNFAYISPITIILRCYFLTSQRRDSLNWPIIVIFQQIFIDDSTRFRSSFKKKKKMFSRANGSKRDVIPGRNFCPSRQELGKRERTGEKVASNAGRARSPRFENRVERTKVMPATWSPCRLHAESIASNSLRSDRAARNRRGEGRIEGPNRFLLSSARCYRALFTGLSAFFFRFFLARFFLEMNGRILSKAATKFDFDRAR